MEKIALDDGEPPKFEDHEEFKEGAEDLPGHFGFYKRVRLDSFVMSDKRAALIASIVFERVQAKVRFDQSRSIDPN